MEFLSMLTVIISAVILSWLMRKINLPGLLGMLIVGIITGPYTLNFISPRFLAMSADIRQIALIIILLRAGLALDIEALKKIGRPALLMSFIPPIAEIGAVIVFAPMVFPITYLDAAIIGTVLCAVSPAIVVPRMLKMVERKQGTEKRIPQLIMAATSVNGIFAIVLFALLLGLEGSGGGFTMILRGAIIPMAIVIIGVIILRYSVNYADNLSKILTKIWIPAEFALFILVGAAINLSHIRNIGIPAIALIIIALLFRVCIVPLCLAKTHLNTRERLFCAIAYSPKATVQAAIGGTALAVGMESGKIVLTIAVFAILITAPLGAVGIDLICRKNNIFERGKENRM